MELVLIGTGGCSAWDVVNILAKGREAVEDVVVELDADRAAEEPRVFTRIHMHFVVRAGASTRPRCSARSTCRCRNTARPRRCWPRPPRSPTTSRCATRPRPSRARREETQERHANAAGLARRCWWRARWRSRLRRRRPPRRRRSTPRPTSRSSKLLRESPAAQAIAGRALAVLVFPDIVKAGFGVGGQFGEGALRRGGVTRRLLQPRLRLLRPADRRAVLFRGAVLHDRGGARLPRPQQGLRARRRRQRRGRDRGLRRRRDLHHASRTRSSPSSSARRA